MAQDIGSEFNPSMQKKKKKEKRKKEKEVLQRDEDWGIVLLAESKREKNLVTTHT
jgi:hypothetical protein